MRAMRGGAVLLARVPARGLEGAQAGVHGGTHGLRLRAPPTLSSRASADSELSCQWARPSGYNHRSFVSNEPKLVGRIPILKSPSTTPEQNNEGHEADQGTIIVHSSCAAVRALVEPHLQAPGRAAPAPQDCSFFCSFFFGEHLYRLTSNPAPKRLSARPKVQAGCCFEPGGCSKRRVACRLGNSVINAAPPSRLQPPNTAAAAGSGSFPFSEHARHGPATRAESDVGALDARPSESIPPPRLRVMPADDARPLWLQ